MSQQPPSRGADDSGATRLDADPTPGHEHNSDPAHPAAGERVERVEHVERAPEPVAAPAPRPEPDRRAEPAPLPGRREDVRSQREAFGGIKWGSAFFGWLSANGLAVILLALATAAGTAVGLSKTGSAGNAANAATSNAGTLGVTGGIVLLLILMLSYFAGGYVAGRMSRFDGLRQGLAVWIVGLLAVLLAALLATVLGAKYNVFSALNLPSIPVGPDTLTRAGLIALASVLVGTLLAAIFGGKLGERYHRKVDRAGVLD